MIKVRALSQELPAEAPTEFRIFRAGVNATSKGETLFDAEAAAAVMANYTREGHDLMVDLEHHALEADASARADAADARGWFKLEMRSGELWAVDVKWTPDGVRRLSERTQRYISPAFRQDTKTNRVVSLLNVALCAMPATYSAAPLVAASKAAGAKRMACYALAMCLALSARQTPKVKNGSR